MAQVKEEEITNNKIRSKFRNIPKVEGIWRNKQLLFLGIIAQMSPSKCPKQLLTTTYEGKRNREWLFKIIQDLFVNGLKLLIGNIDKYSNLKDWYSFTRDKTSWTKMVKNRIYIKKRNFRNINNKLIANINTDNDES